MERQEIEEKYKWDLSPIFTNDEAWEKEFESVKSGYDFTGYKGKLSDKTTLKNLLKKEEEFSRRAEKLYLYASMRHDEDVRVAKYISYQSKIHSLYTEISAQLCYYEPEMMSMDEGYLQELINDPAFADHDYSFRRMLAQRAHVLSEGEERIMALAGNVMGGFRDVFSMMDNADLPLPVVTFNGEKKELTHGLYGVVMHDGTRKERKDAFKGYYKAYASLLNSIASAYIGNVKKDIFYKEARGYASCLAMAMEHEDVSPKVYKNLISAVRKGLPSLHRYMSLRKKILKLNKQHMYDIYQPLVENADIKLPYEKAYEKVVEGLAPLGKEYQALLRRAFNERWIDVKENSGKRSGAYSTGVYDSHPYVLLNYTQTTNEIFTIAHEMGHSIHTFKSNEGQPYAKSSYTIFLAEIASTVNEVLLLKHLYKTTDDKRLKKFLLNYYIDMFRTTLFRQTQFAEFEQLAHEKAENGEPLTKDALNEMYYGLNKKYYGRSIVHDEEIAYEWARIPHFYNSFYVYKYATGITSAISIVKRILSEGKPAVDDYFEFLSSGGKTCPVDILRKAGIDLTSREPFEAAMQEFKDTLNEFEKLND